LRAFDVQRTPAAPILFLWSDVVVEVAFVTCRELPEMHADDRLAADVLRDRGIPVVSAVWDDPAVDWRRYGCVVIRSAWDYHHHQDRYAAWLRQCARDGVRLWNPPAAVLANMNKRYLSDLAQRGVEVVPTEYLPVRHGQTLRGLLERRGWDQAVVKPAVSASAYRTWRTALATADRDQPVFEEDSDRHEVLIQPHVEEIVTCGRMVCRVLCGPLQPLGDQAAGGRRFSRAGRTRRPLGTSRSSG
jgi:hypothetical protein